MFSLTASRSAGDIAITYPSFSCINQFYIRLAYNYFDEFVLSHSGFAGLCARLRYKACGSTRRRSRSELFRDKDLKKRNDEIFSRIEKDLRWPQNQRRESTKLLLFSPNNWESKHLHVYCLSSYLYCIQKYIWEEIC